MSKQLPLFLALLAMAGLMCGPIPAAAQSSDTKLSEEQLDTLLGPVALYPDPLLAQILPASTAPGDVVMAYRYVAAKKDENKIDEQPWEESVKALARYPDVLKMMDEKLDWTTELGQAFVAQPDDVYNSVQRLRAKAQSVGNLKDSPQQVVVVEKEVIKIMPADPQVIYVPQYQPSVVYVQQPPTVVAPIITFGAGLALGIWIHNELDWHNHNVYYHNYGWNNSYHGGGNYYRGGNNVNIDNSKNINIGNGSGNNGSVWKPQNRPKSEQLPAFGNNGNRPGSGGNNLPNGGNRQPGNGNLPGKPAQLPATGNNRLPGNGAPQKPAIRPEQPSNRPSQQPANSFSRDGTKERPAAGGNRPASTNRPAPAANRAATPARPTAGNNAGGGGGGRLQR